MKFAVLILFFLLATGVQAQPPKAKATPAKKPASAKPKAVPTPTPLSEKEQFEKASAHELAVDRVAALEKFLAAFPQSENRPAAADLMTSSRSLIAEEKLIVGSPAEAVTLFKQVVAEAPTPMPDDLFNEAIAKIPTTLFRRGQRAAAFELAALIESKIENSTVQLLEIANFYISVENGSEAMRVAAKAAAKDPTSAAVYRTLALGHRINFELEESANAYAKALELEPASTAAKRGLAEMKRALGKPDEAATLYRELLAKSEADTAARSGLVLSLFDAGKRTEAESELAAAIEKMPGNFVLIAGAAYWYASRGIGDKAVELAEKALAKESRYVWAHIALARGLMAQGKPVMAEQVLVRARAHGNFPTLEYEIASARMAAGFYRDAVEDVTRHFSLSGGGVKTNLGGRVAREEKSFYDLVAYERKAGILTPGTADTIESAETLRALLDLEVKLQAAEPNESEIAAAADAFVKGTDKMKLHRQLHAANLLLQKRVALAKVLELAKAATGNTDAALDVASSGAAVMASELYESRAAAFRKNEFLLVPDVPRPTLSAILRGRIEEITGWALYHQGNFPDAIIRLRRAISVMPDKSAWWRSSMWRLGAALAADGKDTEALNAYIESYKTDKPDFAKYAVVESLYRKVNGNIEGLEAKIGVERVATFTPTIQPTPTGAPVVSSTADPVPAPTATTTENPSPTTITPVVAKPESDAAKKIVSTTEKEVVKPDAAVLDPAKSAPVEVVEKPAVDTKQAGDTKAVDKPVEDPKPNQKTSEEKALEKRAEDPKPIEKTTEDPKPVDKRTEEKPAEKSTEDPKPVDKGAPDPRPAEKTTEDQKPAEKKIEDLKPGEKTALDPKPAEKTTEELKPSEKTALDTKPSEKTTEDPKPVEKIALDPKPAEKTTEDPKLVEKPTEDPKRVEKTVEDPKPVDKTTEDPKPVAKSAPDETIVEKPAEDTKVVSKAESRKPAVIIESTLEPERPDPKIRKPAATRTSQRSTRTSAASEKPSAEEKASTLKPLFEPIVITIPNRQAANPQDAAGSTGAARVRVIDGQEVKSDEPPPCTVGFSQDNVSLINGGGRVGILVNVEGGDIKSLVALPSSPKDIEVTLEPEIVGMPDRRFYVIKSVSSALGVYQVKFAAPCGRKDLIVTVR